MPKYFSRMIDVQEYIPEHFGLDGSTNVEDFIIFLFDEGILVQTTGLVDHFRLSDFNLDEVLTKYCDKLNREKSL